MRNTILITLGLIAGIVFSPAHASQNRYGDPQSQELFSTANSWLWSKPDPVMQRKHNAIAAARTKPKLTQNRIA